MRQTIMRSIHRAVSVIVLAGVLHATATAQERAALRERVIGLGRLTAAPAMHPANGYAVEDGARAVFYDALPWRGKPTRVFAWLGIPEGAKGKLPGIVLVHGGGGTAFKEWVTKWRQHGFAAISIAVEGQTDVRLPPDEGRGWQRHSWAGPRRVGIYGDSAEPLADQWMYHAVADTVLANSLLRSLPEVDPGRVGLMGISWGGIIASTVIGIDRRFAFAIPTYGCGDLAHVDNQYGRALGENSLYQEVWDPMVRMTRATTPTLWLSWTGDQHFPLDSLSRCYRAAAGPHMVALLPNMKHGHAAGWNPPDSYAFAQSVIQMGKPWCRQVGLEVNRGEAIVDFNSTRAIDNATLISTLDTGFTGRRQWKDASAEFRQDNECVRVNATLAPETTAWFINLRSGDLTASSDFQEMR